jgi:hypothetical protein
MLTPDEWTNVEFTVKLQSSIPGLANKDAHSAAVLKALALEMIDQLHPQDSWTQAYTDGSAKDALTDGGSGVNIKYPNGKRVSI